MCTGNNGASLNHAYIDAMPFNTNAFNAELTWHKALMEAESEFVLQHKPDQIWQDKTLAQHHPSEQRIHRSMVGVDEGMVHLIEGSHESINGVKGDFGRIVMRGHRLRNNNEGTQCTKADAEQFRGLYKEFDWTHLLDQ